MKSILRIGTRGSELALRQTNLVVQALQKLQPDLEVETIIIKTEGDKFQGPIPDRAVGKAWFTAEIEEALIEKRVDLAVHSLKDMPVEIPEELEIMIALEREDPRDVLITRSGLKFAALPAGAIIGTDSNRRGAQILHARPELAVKSIRGNVDTRIRKLHEQDYDGIVIAAAGVRRLGRQGEITEFFEPTKFIPAIGQGALALEIRKNHAELAELIKQTQHSDTCLAVEAERQFSTTIGGGCKLPIGCFAEVDGTSITVHGMVGKADGSKVVGKTMTGPIDDRLQLADNLANYILERCDFSLELES